MGADSLDANSSPLQDCRRDILNVIGCQYLTGLSAIPRLSRLRQFTNRPDRIITGRNAICGEKGALRSGGLNERIGKTDSLL